MTSLSLSRWPLALGCLFSLGTTWTLAEHWPQWRGPLGTGAAPEAQPPLEWAEDKNVRWKVPIPGRGSSTPVVWADRIFIQTAIPAKPVAAPPKPAGAPAGGEQRGGRGMRSVRPSGPVRFVLLCLDRATGKTRWERTVREEVPHEGHHGDHGYASHSPVTDGRLVIAYFGSRGLHCFDLDGKPKWSKDLGRMRTKNTFGEGSSPALADDMVVVNWDHEGDDFIVALDAATGKERWRQPRTEDTSWGTPLVVRHGGKAQVVTAATRKVRAYDLQSGKQLWEGAGLTPNSIPTPVAGKEMVYVTSGFRGNALRAIRLGHSGDVTGTDAVAWSQNRNTPYVPSPLLSGDRLYLYSGNNALLSCLDAGSGKTLFGPERVAGLQGVYASPIAAGGRVYLVGRTGVTVVIRDADKLEVLATNKLDDRIDASPATVGKELFLRGHEHLYCIAEK